MATIKFFLQSKSNPSKIYIRLIDGKKIDIKCTTNLLINPDDWNPEKQAPKSLKRTALKEINARIHELRSDLINTYNKSSQNIDLLWLKNFINPVVNKDVPNGLVEYIDFYLAFRQNELSEAMRKKVNVVKHKMERMQIERKKTILINDINDSFLNEMVAYYLKHGYSKNTTHRELVFIKTFCKHAKKRGIELHVEFDDLSLDREKVKSIYLTFAELEKIKGVNIDKLPDSLSDARDWLIISCYTAQRVSDFMRFDASMIREQSGKLLIEFEQIKTGKIITLPLHPVVLEILEKREGNFPVKLNDQDYNKLIKTVCEIAELTAKVYGSKKLETFKDSGIFRKKSGLYPKHELVTSHIGRRSFATNFYGKIPTPLLMSATGHSKEETFLIYIGKSDYDKALELANYF